MGKLFKIKRNKFLDSFHYLEKINKIDILKIDYSTFIGRDLTEKEKNEYVWSYERKSTTEILNIILNDFIEGRIH